MKISGKMDLPAVKSTKVFNFPPDSDLLQKPISRKQSGWKIRSFGGGLRLKREGTPVVGKKGVSVGDDVAPVDTSFVSEVSVPEKTLHLGAVSCVDWRVRGAGENAPSFPPPSKPVTTTFDLLHHRAWSAPPPPWLRFGSETRGRGVIEGLVVEIGFGSGEIGVVVGVLRVILLAESSGCGGVGDGSGRWLADHSGGGNRITYTNGPSSFKMIVVVPYIKKWPCRHTCQLPRQQKLTGVSLH